MGNNQLLRVHSALALLAGVAAMTITGCGQSRPESPVSAARAEAPQPAQPEIGPLHWAIILKPVQPKKQIVLGLEITNALRSVDSTQNIKFLPDRNGLLNISVDIVPKGGSMRTAKGYTFRINNGQGQGISSTGQNPLYGLTRITPHSVPDTSIQLDSYVLHTNTHMELLDGSSSPPNLDNTNRVLFSLHVTDGVVMKEAKYTQGPPKKP